MLEAVLVVCWVWDMFVIMRLPGQYDTLGKRFAPMLFQNLGLLFLFTGMLMQRFVGLSPSGAGFILIPTALFIFTALFLHLKEKHHN